MNTFEVVAFILCFFLVIFFVSYWGDGKRERPVSIKSDYYIRLQGERKRLLRKAGGEFLIALASSVVFSLVVLIAKWYFGPFSDYGRGLDGFLDICFGPLFLVGCGIILFLLSGSFCGALKFYRVFEIGLMVCRLRKNPDVNAESEVFLRQSILSFVITLLFFAGAVVVYVKMLGFGYGYLIPLYPTFIVGGIGYFGLKGAVEEFARSIRHRMAERIELQNTVLNMAKLLALLESGATAVDSDQIKKTREDFEVFRRRIENELPDSEARKKEKQRQMLEYAPRYEP